MTQSPDVRGFFDPATHTVTYLVSDPATGQAAIIDPVLDFDAPSARTSTRSIDAVMAALQTQGLTLALVLETHAHADHLTAAAHLRAMTGVSIGIGGRITQVQSAFGPCSAPTTCARTGPSSIICTPTATSSRWVT